MFRSSLWAALAVAGAGLVSPALARTGLEGCVSTEVIIQKYYASYIWYVPDTGEICSFLDCGGGRAPPKTTVPGCPLYKGTATITPAYLAGYYPKTNDAGAIVVTTTDLGIMASTDKLVTAAPSPTTFTYLPATTYTVTGSSSADSAQTTAVTSVVSAEGSGSSSGSGTASGGSGSSTGSASGGSGSATSVSTGAAAPTGAGVAKGVLGVVAGVAAGLILV
ncbi:hypothetical protein QBC46DRAFT_379634 [Diplogelasinospora grovesii]|uniref:Siderophore biosynthesis n=1 Tax=Diplogelasinospora grovesii TaxID=303347 RepID=A0AAN6NEE4_9PEZI|nr:hypothetical protein QBC46DRAFT_379634 [Diplogelasinospora grovesii]